MLFPNSFHHAAALLVFSQLSAASPITTIALQNGAEVVINEVVSTVTVTAGASAATGAEVAVVDASGGDNSASVVQYATSATVTVGAYSTFSGAIPAATSLAPAVHVDVDISDTANLLASSGTQLFYSDPAPSNQGMSFHTN